MAKEKETIPKFEGTMTYSKHQVAGITPYSEKKADLTLEEMLDQLEKTDVQSARKDALLAKLKEREVAARKQAEPNPKRWTVDPKTGQIEIDEEEGEYTQKEAMMVSASIKGKGGEYDAAIALITAAKGLVAGNEPATEQRPKEFLVDPETGAITHDPENGEYTLSEARTISYSIQKGKQPESPGGQKSFMEKLDEMTQGLVSQRFAAMLKDNGQPQAPQDPVDEFFRRMEQVDKVREKFAPTGGPNVQMLAQSGVRGELLKLMLEDERERLKMQYDHESQVERNKHLGGIASVVKENLSDGIRALTLAAEEARKGGTGATPEPKQAPETAQSFQCEKCSKSFGIPDVENWAVVGCPHCGAQYTREQVLGGK